MLGSKPGRSGMLGDRLGRRCSAWVPALVPRAPGRPGRECRGDARVLVRQVRSGPVSVMSGAAARQAGSRRASVCGHVWCLCWGFEPVRSTVCSVIDSGVSVVLWCQGLGVGAQVGQAREHATMASSGARRAGQVSRCSAGRSCVVVAPSETRQPRQSRVAQA